MGVSNYNLLDVVELFSFVVENIDRNTYSQSFVFLTSRYSYNFTMNVKADVKLMF